MKLNRKANNKWIIRIVLLASIISALAVMFLMTKIDAIVHGQLYSFSLQYDRSWAKPYNLYTQLMYIGLAVPITLSAVGIALSFKKKNGDAPETATAKPAVSKQETIDPPKPKTVACGA